MLRRYHLSSRKAEPRVHRLALDELAKVLSTSLRNGLDDTKASKLRLKRGENRITSTRRSLIVSILGYFFSGFSGLLWVVAIMNVCNYTVFVVGSQSDPGLLLNACMMFAVVCVSALIYTYQDLHALLVFHEHCSPPRSAGIAHVIRNGEDKRIPVEELVVGDLVCLYAGQRVPADMRIVSASADLHFDRSTLSGECEETRGQVDWSTIKLD